MKLNGLSVPDRITHDEAADLFLNTAVGRATGATREQFLAKLHQRAPTQEALDTLWDSLRVELESMLTPAEGRYTLLDHGHAIRCNRCMKVSWSTGDILNLYCGHCKKFHES